MSEAESLYINICTEIVDAEQSQFFGKPCFKISKKAFVSFFQDQMVFKLDGDIHAKALALDGAHLFDPSGKNRAMKQWVQLPFEHKDKWAEFAKQACQYVSGLKK